MGSGCVSSEPAGELLKRLTAGRLVLGHISELLLKPRFRNPLPTRIAVGGRHHALEARRATVRDADPLTDIIQHLPNHARNRYAGDERSTLPRSGAFLRTHNRERCNRGILRFVVGW